MSGGRGAPKTGLSFNAEALGIGRGKDALPTTVLAPPPVFPVMTAKAKQPLKNDDTDNLLFFYKDYRRHIKESTFYLKPKDSPSEKNGVKIQRYSDKFQVRPFEVLSIPDWSLLPKELLPSEAKKGSKRKSAKAPNLITKKKKDVLKKLDELEAKEVNENAEADDGDEEDKDEEEDETKEVEELSEGEDEDEELDEGTDYANNYFDNGEGYLDDDDDGLDEGGIY